MRPIVLIQALALAASGGVALAQQAPPAPSSGAGTSAPGPEPAAPSPTPEQPISYMPSPPEQPAPAKPAPRTVGVSVLGEAGVLAYSGPLAHVLRAGPSWGADGIIRAHLPVAFEVRYQGASNQLFGSGNFWSGPREARVVQNGGQALVHVPLAPDKALATPYVGAGLGVAWYTVSEPVPGYQSDSLGQIPVSAGVNLHLKPPTQASSLTIGLRGDYEWLFSDQFSPTDVTTDYGFFTKPGGDQYRGELTLGGTF